MYLKLEGRHWPVFEQIPYEEFISEILRSAVLFRAMVYFLLISKTEIPVLFDRTFFDSHSNFMKLASRKLYNGT